MPAAMTVRRRPRIWVVGFLLTWKNQPKLVDLAGLYAIGSVWVVVKMLVELIVHSMKKVNEAIICEE